MELPEWYSQLVTDEAELDARIIEQSVITDHTITLHRNDDRMSDRFGQHYYVEHMNGIKVKVEYLDWKSYDRDHAYTWASAVARTYGASVVDRRPAPCLYGWSSD